MALLPTAIVESEAEYEAAVYGLAAYDFITQALGVDIEWPLPVAIVIDDDDEEEAACG